MRFHESSRRPGFLLGLLVIAALVHMPVPLPSGLAQVGSGEGKLAPDAAYAEGLRLATNGAFEESAVVLHQAATAYADAGDAPRQIDALSALAHAYVALGYHIKASQSLELALTVAQTVKDATRLRALMVQVGQVYLAAGRLDGASEYLTQALSLAEEANDTGQVATVTNELGRLRAAESNYAQALDLFARSGSLAENADLSVLRATATLNAGQATLHLEQYAQAEVWFDQAHARFRTLPASHHQAYGLITIGLAYADLSRAVQASKERLILRAARVLEEAGEIAAALHDGRAESYAFGHRGHLYEQAGRADEALMLTRLAVTAAQQVYAPESLYRWEWQAGRLLKAQGELDKAIDAYRRAARTVQSLRSEMVLTSASGASASREAGGRLFVELADLLLQRAASTPGQEQAQPYLQQARDAIELFKSAELRDYFRDDCVDALQALETPLDKVLVGGTAAIYPILLPDRTEILLSLGGTIRRVSVPVPAATMTREVRALRHFLEKRTTREYLPHAQQLYDWLIRPFESSLQSHEIHTLVVVPDSSLRTIPFAALHDGERFLIARYAIATTPGLNLTDPQPLRRTAVKVLSAGLTEAVQGFPALPHVETELDALKTAYNSEVLLNRTFASSRLQDELREQQFTIVHIASHAQFKSQVDNTFLLTFDDKVTMDRLSQFIGYFRFREQPLELLTLSACETAAGDDRAALGLAGVAIKAGARSALATLWFINDEASSELVARFYRQLQDPKLSKAQALQRAQVSLLQDPAFRHPTYWAPFLLLNNWL